MQVLLGNSQITAINTVLVTNPKHSTVQAARKKVNSVPAKQVRYGLDDLLTLLCVALYLQEKVKEEKDKRHCREQILAWEVELEVYMHVYIHKSVLLRRIHRCDVHQLFMF